MMRSLLFLIISSISLAHAFNVRNVATIMKIDEGRYETGWINMTNGAYKSTGKLKLDQRDSGCSFELGEGRQGQTTTTFYQNSTWFFLAKVSCPDDDPKIAIIGFYASSYSASPEARIFWTSENTTDMMHLNILWDHVCNIIVLSPKDSAMETLMVSEYDRQVRPKAKYMPNNNVWQYINGLAMDRGDFVQDGWPLEGNCGLKCVIYTIEAQVDTNGNALSRRIIGRYFHTGEVASNVSDSVQAQTMSFPPGTTFPIPGQPKPSILYGIGICGTTKCAGAPWIFAYGSGSNTPVVLATLNGGRPLSPEDMEDTIRLGVIVNTEWPRKDEETYLLVYVSGLSHTFQVNKDKAGTPISATLIQKVAVKKPMTWTQAMGVY